MKALINISIIKSLTAKRIFNIIKATSSFFVSNIFKKHILWGKPYILTIEPTNRCNLNCPQCVTGAGKLNRATGRMSFATFQQIIDELSETLCYLVLFNQGEPFLHDELIDFIRYANKKKIYVITSTNGHFLTAPNISEKLVKSGLDSIIISVDGADDKTYNKYRTGGNFDKVIKGVKKLVHYKKLSDKKNPKIFLQFLIMKHNEHQHEKIKFLAKELKVDKVLFKTVQVENYEQAIKFLPENKKWSRYTLNNNKLQLKYPTNSACSRLWTSSTILCDGTVVPCCFDKNGNYAFGFIKNRQFFEQIWRSEKYVRFRLNILRQRESIDLCTNCTQGQKVFL